jgi:hypothetical protein
LRLLNFSRETFPQLLGEQLMPALQEYKKKEWRQQRCLTWVIPKRSIKPILSQQVHLQAPGAIDPGGRLICVSFALENLPEGNLYCSGRG